MRTVLLTLGFIFTLILNAVGQIHDQEKFNTLKEDADLVVFGELTEKTSFWGSNRRMIFTSNWINVFTTIKGEEFETVEIITNGGTVGEIEQWWSHETGLPDNARGYFFLKRMTSETIKENYFFRLNGHDGFIPLRTKQASSPPASFIVTDTIVEFGFDNIEIDLPYLQFDVLIRSNISGIDFGKGEVLLQYPTSVFGTDAVANDFVETEKGDVINSSEYSITLSDEDSDIFEAFVDGGCTPPSGAEGGIPLSTDFQTFMTVSLEVQDFNALGTISMDELGMEGRVYYYDKESSSCKPFADVIVPDPIETGLVCSITSFTDTIAIAGVDTLTIFGNNFDSPGQVEFANAENGGDPTAPAVTHPGDILKWNSDTIIVKIPTEPDAAGYGIFNVRTSSGMLCPSPDTLDICYAVRNRRAASGEAVRVHLGSITGGNKYVFRPDSILGNNPVALNTIEKALCDWNAVTKINWELGSILVKPAQQDFDSLNHIFMAPASEFGVGSGAAAQTIVTRVSCQNTSPPFGLLRYSGDIDIMVREDLATLPIPVTGGWNFSHTTPPASNQYDFYTVILHELGHAHNLKHAMPLPKAMFWESNAGDTLRTLDAKDILGANDIMNTSTAVLGQSTQCFPIDTASLCGTTNIVEIQSIGQIAIFPNPTTSQVNIHLNLKNTEELVAYVSDVTGKRITQVNYGELFSGEHLLKLNIEENNPVGIYFLTLNFKEHVQSFKILKL